jgi:hypothetical protein
VLRSRNYATPGDHPIYFAPPIEPAAPDCIERRLHLEFNKWATQVGDVRVLSGQPLVVQGNEWKFICLAAECLAAETEQMEEYAVGSPRDLSEIGIPRNLREILIRAARPKASTCRVMRFDFHHTASGWRESDQFGRTRRMAGGHITSAAISAILQ